MKRTILIIVLLFVSCQKDYYLDELNDALSQVSSLQSKNQILNSQILQLQSEINNLNVKSTNLQTNYDQLYQLYQAGQTEIEELNNKIIELADLLRIEQAMSNSLSDGYYLAAQVSSIVNDSIIWEVDEIPKRIDFFVGEVVKIENNSIVENYRLTNAQNYWNNVNNNKIVKYRTYPSRDYTYAKEFGNKMHINEYTGDSLPYFKNLKVIDKDVFTNNLITPKNKYGDRLVYKYAYHKLFSEPYEIIEGITYPPVVNIGNSYWDINDYQSFDDIKNVFDYSSSSNFLSDSIYAEIDQSDPKSYLAAFIKDAERNGVDLSNVDPDLLETKPWFTPTDQSGRYITAWGSITCSKTYNRIGYNNGWFEGTFLTDSRWYKLWVMYHEFGHTVLGLKHTCAKNHIMTSSSSTGNYPCNGEVIEEYENISQVDHFKRAVSDMFNGYNQFYYDCYLNSSNTIIDVE